MTDADLVDEREPIGMVELDADLGQASKNGARLQRFRFPPQDHGAKVGRRSTTRTPRRPSAMVTEVDDLAGTVTIYRTATELERGIPASLIPNDFVRTTVIEDSLLRIGRWVAEEGIAGGDAGAPMTRIAPGASFSFVGPRESPAACPAHRSVAPTRAPSTPPCASPSRSTAARSRSRVRPEPARRTPGRG